VNSKDVPERELQSSLRDALGKVDQKIVVFQGDRKVLLGDMVRILNIAKAAGAEQIAIAAKRVTGAQLENNPSGGGSGQ
jgi:biopolymer transport protein ExbD